MSRLKLLLRFVSKLFIQFSGHCSFVSKFSSNFQDIVEENAELIHKLWIEGKGSLYVCGKVCDVLFFVFVYFLASMFAKCLSSINGRYRKNHFVIISVFLNALVSLGPGWSTDQHFLVVKIGRLVVNIGSQH